MTIEEIALEQAREWLNNTLVVGASISDARNKLAMDKHYPGGWDAWYEETFRQVVG